MDAQKPDQAAAYVHAADPNVPSGIKAGEWSSGVFSCFDNMMPNCCMSWCCTCVTVAQVAHRVGWMNYSTALVVFGLLMLLAPFSGISFIILAVMLMSLRGSVRKQFNIPGDAVSDCCCSCCCTCCVAAQMATHVQSYTPGDCSFAAPQKLDQLPAYNA